MNVTRQNFASILPEITAKIKKANFVALDLEFTGLPDDNKFSRLDDHESRYVKTANEMKGYFVLQYGLSIFSQNSEKRNVMVLKLIVITSLFSLPDLWIVRHIGYKEQTP